MKKNTRDHLNTTCSKILIFWSGITNVHNTFSVMEKKMVFYCTYLGVLILY